MGDGVSPRSTSRSGSGRNASTRVLPPGHDSGLGAAGPKTSRRDSRGSPEGRAVFASARHVPNLVRARPRTSSRRGRHGARERRADGATYDPAVVPDAPPGHRERDRPYVLVGAEEYSLHEADALIDALTQLVDRGAEVSPPRRTLKALSRSLTRSLRSNARHVHPHGRRRDEQPPRDLLGGHPSARSSMISRSRGAEPVGAAPRAAAGASGGAELLEDPRRPAAAASPPRRRGRRAARRRVLPGRCP